MKNPKGILFLCAFASLIISSCKKNPTYPVIYPGFETTLQIQFNDNTIPQNLVDSVIAVFKIPGSTNIIKRKMTETASAYVISANDLTFGIYNVEYNVYTRKLPGTLYGHLFKFKKTISFPLQTSDNITGPNGKYTDAWTPNFLFKNDEKNVTLIVAERVGDSYFEIRAPQLNGYKITMLDRATYGSNYVVDHEVWLSNTNPFVNGNYTNNIFFADFAERMKTKEWARSEISFYIEDAAGSNVTFSLTHYPRP
jgi:hypothetical protein